VRAEPTRSTVTKAGLLRSARKDGSPPLRIGRSAPHAFLDGGGVALDDCSSFAHTGSHGSPPHRPDGSVSALPLRMRLRADRSSPGLSTGVLDPPEHAAEDAALHDRRCVVHAADVRAGARDTQRSKLAGDKPPIAVFGQPRPVSPCSSHSQRSRAAHPTSTGRAGHPRLSGAVAPATFQNAVRDRMAAASVPSSR